MNGELGAIRVRGGPRPVALEDRDTLGGGIGGRCRAPKRERRRIHAVLTQQRPGNPPDVAGLGTGRRRKDLELGARRDLRRVRVFAPRRSNSVARTSFSGVLEQKPGHRDTVSNLQRRTGNEQQRPHLVEGPNRNRFGTKVSGKDVPRNIGRS